MRTTTKFAALAMCASLYLTMGSAQAGLTSNGVHLNGSPQNGLSQNGVLVNGINLNRTTLGYEPTPEVQRESLPFNGLSQKGLGKTHP
jgi:hypothetical protein